MWRLNIVVCGRSHTFSSAMVILALILHRLSWEAGHSEYRNRCHREDCVRHRSAGEIRAGSQIATLPFHRAARCQVTRAKNETTTLMGSQSTIGTINEESKRKLWARVCVLFMGFGFLRMADSELRGQPLCLEAARLSTRVKGSRWRGKGFLVKGK